MACGCSRLRMNAVTLDSGFRLHPYSWDGLFGYPGKGGTNERVVGRDGAYRQGPKLALPRTFTLGLLIRPHDATGAVTSIVGPCEHLEANEDLILGIIGSDDPVYLEWDTALGATRFLNCEFVDAMPIEQDGVNKRIPIIGQAWYPMWQAETLTTDVVTGTQSKTFGGNAPNGSCVVEFGAAGRLTDNTDGSYVEVTGAGYPVVVDCLERTVKQGSTEVDNRFSPGNSRWIRPKPGNISFTASAGSITLKHRDSWW